MRSIVVECAPDYLDHVWLFNMHKASRLQDYIAFQAHRKIWLLWPKIKPRTLFRAAGRVSHRTGERNTQHLGKYGHTRGETAKHRDTAVGECWSWGSNGGQFTASDTTRRYHSHCFELTNASINYFDNSQTNVKKAWTNGNHQCRP